MLRRYSNLKGDSGPIGKMLLGFAQCGERLVLNKVYDAVTQNWKMSHVWNSHTHCLLTWKKFCTKKNFFCDNFYLVKLMQPLEIFAPSKVTLPPTLVQPQIGDQTPFAIMKKISKIWSKVLPRFWINPNKPFLTEAGFHFMK